MNQYILTYKSPCMNCPDGHAFFEGNSVWEVLDQIPAWLETFWEDDLELDVGSFELYTLQDVEPTGFGEDCYDGRRVKWRQRKDDERKLQEEHNLYLRLKSQFKDGSSYEAFRKLEAKFEPKKEETNG